MESSKTEQNVIDHAAVPKHDDSKLETTVTANTEVKEGGFSDSPRGDGLHRRLGNRQIQLIAIGGSIGTALFVSIGGALNKAGPAGLLIAFALQTFMISLVNNSMAEMSTYMPITGGFIRHAGHWVDDAWGFMAGWNFFIYESLTVPFEISAVNLLLGFWSDNVPPAAVCVACIVLYAVLNISAVGIYGESEFWLSGGKVILIFLLFGFTFVTMVGGNPQHDAYGFRYWNSPGPFAEYSSTGDLGRFEGFLGAVWIAIFTIVGPEYISMVAAEAKHPRVYIKNASKVVYVRFIIFFILGALCVGVIVAYNDPSLVDALTSGTSTAAASPYVIAMQNLGITGLPHVASALMVTSVFSAGNTYFYAATRGLYGLAVEGRAPRFLAKTTKRGIPVYCFVVVMGFACLSFLACSNGAMKVLNWLISLTTANIIINYIVATFTYTRFYHACSAQNFDRSKLPYTGRFQPYCAYIALVWEIICVFTYGYMSFKPFDVESFILNYLMLMLAPVLFVGWKIAKKTRFLRPHEVDLRWEADIVAAYEDSELDPPTTFWREMLDLLLFRGLRKQVKQIATR